MKKHVCIPFAAVFLFLIFSPKCACSPSPHIIFMLIDDLGWNDVSFHGSPQIPTPNIDALAYNGIILNNYYVQPICTPSRGCLMTGKYPIKLGLQHFVIGAGEPWGLSPKEIILPQYLKDLGYVTHGVGKWHLGYFKKEYVPTKRGFDSFFGYYEGKGDLFTHFDVEEELSGLDFHDDDRIAWDYFGYYSTEAFTDRAKKIISNHNSSKPLFLYISHQAVHAGNEYSPLQAPNEYIHRFSHIKDEERRTFAAMTSALDKSVGDVFSALYEKKMLKNSIIIFSTDNGGAVEGIDSSTGSNWPLRGSKYNMWEGGVRGTAFIWSLLTKSRKSISENLMHISDWLPTLYAAAGGNTAKLGEIDGYNFWPTFNGNLSSPRDHILHNIDSEWKVESIRKNQYKLLKGSVFDGEFDGWFDKEGKKEARAHFDDEELDMLHKIYKKEFRNSQVYQILKKCEGEFRLYDDLNCIGNHEHCDSESNQLETCNEVRENGEETCFMHYFSNPVEVQCGTRPENASTNCSPMEDYCLFDIEKDPCEFNNLANALPSVSEELKQLLNEYRKKVVPIRNKDVDPNANPKYHGYAFVPWVEDKAINAV